jgi:hypothetical protein
MTSPDLTASAATAIGLAIGAVVGGKATGVAWGPTLRAAAISSAAGGLLVAFVPSQGGPPMVGPIDLGLAVLILGFVALVVGYTYVWRRKRREAASGREERTEY